MLAGVALQSVDALHGAVSLPRLRLLAVLAGLGVPGPARRPGGGTGNRHASSACCRPPTTPPSPGHYG